jgi:hypothetical protein
LRVSFHNKQRHAVWQKNYISFLLSFFILVSSVVALLVLQTSTASAATSTTLNFQGRLLSNTGGLVPDGSYNIEFKIYDDPTAGTNHWTENRTGGNTVTVKNGYFSVYLGEVTPFGATIPWDQELYMTMNVNGDGEMTPRFKLTAVPYAFRAAAITDSAGNDFTPDDLIQKSPASVQSVNTAVAAIRLNQAGSGSIVQLQGNGTDVFTVDKLGNTVLGAGITIGNSSSTTAGTIRWNGSTFQGYNGSTWAPLGSSAVTPFVSKTKTADETQNNVVNPTAALQNDDELFFSIGANETWNFRFTVLANANVTPDIKFAVTAPTGATCKVGTSDPEGATSVSNLGCGASTGLVTGNTTEDVYEVVGSVTNGANAGNITLQWAQNTANAANVIVRSGSFVEASRSVGGSNADVAFIQNGNSFGGLAVLGTNDAFGLSFETNGTERLLIQSTGDIQAKDDLIANRTATGTTGTTTGTGTNTTTLNLLADSFAVNDVVFIDNVGQDYYTRITADPGTGSYTVSPAVTYANARTVTKYTIQNIGATDTDYTNQANRFFQGYFLGGVVVGAGSTTVSDGSIESTTTLRLQSNGGDVELGGGLTVTGTLTGDASGLTNINGASVNGSAITGIDASNIASGTLGDGRLSANVALLNAGQTFSALTTFGAGLSVTGNTNVTGDIAATGALSGATVSGDGSGLTNLSSANLTGALPAISGASLTSLNASNISSGTLADGRLSANIALLNGGQTFSALTTFGAGVSITGNSNITGDFAATGAISGLTISGDGSALSALNASNIASGTLADARLSTNVTLLGNTFNGINQLVRLDGSGNLPTLNGSALTNLSSANLSGALPAISGASLTSLNASNISSGTLADGRLSANVVLLNGGQTFSALTTFGAGLSVTGNTNATGDISATGAVSGLTISGDGSALTALNASNIASGTLADARLSTNVALLTGSQTFTGTKTFSSGIVLGLTTLTSSATGASAVDLPDEAGTVCFSNKDTCGYLRFAAGSVQTDASTNDVLAVNKTNATGNLISLQRSGAAVFTVANSGALQIQSTSATALDIRNAGGTSYFSVDTSTGTVRVGPTAADGTGILFVLDTKNSAGDPTGVAGGQYYNSSDGKFRCYENGAWKDCIQPINNVPLMDMFNTSATATNLALNTLNCVSDPSLRMMMNLNGQSRLRFMARIGGTINAATTIRLQYHLGGNPAVATGDAGWTTLATSAGGHTLNTLFYTAETAIPAGAQTNDVLVRACLFSGNGVADPTITGVTINTYD